MAIIPVLLDEHPSYLDGEAEHASSLLLASLRTGTLLDEIATAVTSVASHAITVVSAYAGCEPYAERVRRICPRVDRVVRAEVMGDPLAHFDACDLLLLVSPRHYPVEGIDFRPLVAAAGDGVQTTHHLLAVETTSQRTKELVHGGVAGRVRRVQRYFEAATWPFSAGVIASMAPVVCLLQCADARWSSLAQLRAALAASGAPSVDVPLQATLHDLASEEGMLALCEQRVLAAATPSRRRWSRAAAVPLVTPDASIAPTACLVGPVAVREGAVIDADALVVGPALIGPGARIGRNSVVAQCTVGAGVSLPDNSMLRHRVVMRTNPEHARPHPRRNLPPATTPAPSTGGYTRLKRFVEPAIAAMVLALLSPVFVAVGVLVKLTSAGPMFYGDPREGMDGRRFRCWKFRTMLVNADKMQRALAAAQDVDGPHFKMERDPRVTPVGRWLRACTLDELPQLVNVVRGEMSFVGPRPGPLRENQICVPWRSGRLSVQPGITGLWQVCRHDRSAGDFHQWIEYDLLYVRHASLRVDVRIVIATVAAILSGRPARVERIIGERAGHDVPPQHTTRRRARVLPKGNVRLRKRAIAVMRRSAGVTAASACVALSGLTLCLPAARLGAQGASDADHPPVGERFWTLELGLGQGYTSNVLFAEPNGTGDVLSRGSGQFGFTSRDSRTQMDLTANGSMARYEKLTNLDQFTYGVRADVTRAMTQRLTLGAAAQAQTALSSDVVTAPGLPLLPLALSRTQSVTGSGSYRTSEMSSIASAVGYSRSTFASSALSNGESLYGLLTASHAYSQSGTFSVLYQAQRSVSGGQRLVSHSAAGDVTAVAGPVRWSVRGGAAALAESGQSHWIVQSQGQLEVQNARTTNGTVALRYSRSAGQQFGLARILVSDEIGVTLDRTIWSATALNASASQSWSSDVNRGSARIISSAVTAGLRRNLPGGLWVELGGFYRSRVEAVSLAGSGVMLTAGYRVSR